MSPADEILARLKGSWAIAALEMDGQAVPGSSLAGASVEVKGSRFISTGMGAVYEGTLTVRPEASPAEFDLKFTKGPEKGNTAYGIYRLEGDQWQICLTTRGSQRPTEFATKPGTGHALETLTRGAAPVVAKPSVPEGAEIWKLVSGFAMGHNLDKRMVASGRRVISGNEVSVRFGDYEQGRSTFTIDGNHIDYVNLIGPTAGQTQLGLIETDGKWMRVCMAPAGKPRPDSFEATAANGWTSTLWENV